jgi:hypothetical protein
VIPWSLLLHPDALLTNEIKDVVDSFDEFEKTLHVVSFQHPPTGDVVDNFESLKSL